MELLELAPDDVNLDLQLGYLYKTLAQTFARAGQPEKAARYRDLAFGVFQRIKDGASTSALPAYNLAEAINGLGNIYAERGEIDEAIRNYRVAVEIYPQYSYAWHDLFGAYYEKARRGVVLLPEMEEALARTRATGQGQPGLSAEYLAKLDGLLMGWKLQAAATSGPRAATRTRGRRRPPRLPGTTPRR